MKSVESCGINFNAKKLCGDGGTAKVYRVETPEGPAALKVARSNPLATRQVRREAEILAELNHPHIIGYWASGEQNVKGTKLPWILMDYAEGDMTTDTALPPAIVVAAINQAAQGLDYLHTRAEVVHGDLKPENLMRHRRKVVIADFGTARTMPGKRSAAEADNSVTNLFTQEFAAPEIWERFPITDKTDVYALAAITRELLTGEELFDEIDADGYDRAHTRRIPSTLAQTLQDNMTAEHEFFEETLQVGLAKDPLDRPSAREFGERLVMDLSRARDKKSRKNIT